MAVNTSEALDLSKENIQPLRQGRKASRLDTVLQVHNVEIQQQLRKERENFEQSIRTYEGDDPLQLYWEYVCWLEQSYPNQGPENNMVQLLENIITKFKDYDAYKQDSRFVQILIKYAVLQPNPLELYQMIYNQGLGIQCAAFYKAWAEELDNCNDFKRADQIFQLGVHNKAQPAADLEEAHMRFQLCVGRRLLGGEIGLVQENAGSEQRTVLTRLKPSSIGSSRKTKGLAGTLPLSQQNNNNKRTLIKVYDEKDADEKLYTPSSKTLLEKIPKASVSNKENVLKPGKWCGEKQKILEQFTPTVPTTPSFKIHVDAESVCGSRITTTSLNALQPKKENRCPVAIFEPPNPNIKPMYPKNLVYAGGRDFSLEELRAERYWKSMRAKESNETPGRNSIVPDQNENDCVSLPSSEQKSAIVSDQRIEELCNEINNDCYLQQQAAINPSTVEHDDPMNNFCDIPKKSSVLLNGCQASETEVNVAIATVSEQKESINGDEVIKMKTNENNNCFSPTQDKSSVVTEIKNSDNNNYFSQIRNKHSSITEVNNDNNSYFSPIRDRSNTITGMKNYEHNNYFAPIPDEDNNQSSNVIKSSAAVNNNLPLDENIVEPPSNNVRLNVESNERQREEMESFQSEIDYEKRKIIDFMFNASDQNLSVAEMKMNQSEKLPNNEIDHSHCFSIFDVPNISIAQSPSTSITVNTRAAMNVIQQMWTSPSPKSFRMKNSSLADDFSNPNITFKVPIVPKSTRTPGLAPFSLYKDDDNEDVKSNDNLIRGKMPFQIFSDDQKSSEEKLSASKGGNFFTIFQDIDNAKVNSATSGIATAMSSPTTTRANNSKKDDNGSPFRLSYTHEKPTSLPFTIYEESVTDRNYDDDSEKTIKRTRCDFNGSADLLKSKFSTATIKEEGQKYDKSTLNSLGNRHLGTSNFLSNCSSNVAVAAAPSTSVKKCLADGDFSSATRITNEAVAVENNSEMLNNPSNDTAVTENFDCLLHSNFVQPRVVISGRNNDDDLAVPLENLKMDEENDKKRKLPYVPPPNLIKDDLEPEDKENNPPFNHVLPSADKKRRTLGILVPSTDIVIDNANDLDTETVVDYDDDNMEAVDVDVEQMPPSKDIVAADCCNSNAIKGLETTDHQRDSHRPTVGDGNNNDGLCLQDINKTQMADFEDVTCNTKAFAFVLTSSTPYNKQSSRKSTIDASAVENLAAALTAKKTVKSDQNLSMILETSKERYTSSSGSSENGSSAICKTFILSEKRKTLGTITEQNTEIEESETSQRKHINPFDEQLISELLSEINVGQRTPDNYVKINSSLPFIKQSSVVKLGNDKWMILSDLGKGSYAKIVKAQLQQPLNKSESITALKIQKPACEWEWYIVNELHSRLPSDKKSFFINFKNAYIYDNGSVLVADWAPYGTVLDFVSRFKLVKKVNCPLYISTHFSQQMVSAIEYLHSCHIIHGDVKPDNFVITTVPSASKSCIQLIDFGRSIDMKLFPAGTTFTHAVKTDGFICHEMRENKPWNYQTDLYGLAGSMYVLLMGDYMKTTKRENTWVMVKPLPRYMRKEMLDPIFKQLLNIPSCDKLPNLSDIKELLQELLAAFDQYTIQQQLAAAASILTKK